MSDETTMTDRELNVAVALEVLDFPQHMKKALENGAPLPNYSGDISWTWACVVAELVKKGYYLCLQTEPEQQWLAEWSRGDCLFYAYAKEDSPQRAICLAAVRLIRLLKDNGKL